MSNRTLVRLAVPAVLVCVGAVALAASDARERAANDWIPIEVHGGTAQFVAETNVSMISVHGESGALEARARVRVADDALEIDGLEAIVAVETLKTGIGLRDHHMTKYVFTTDDGRVPDLRFAGGQTSCTNGPTGGSSCHVEGELTIRDTRRPFAIDLKVDRSGQSFRASGDGVVLLSTYGIERPSQLGVTTRDEVRLHLEFTAAPVTSVPASGGAR